MTDDELELAACIGILRAAHHLLTEFDSVESYCDAKELAMLDSARSALDELTDLLLDKLEGMHSRPIITGDGFLGKEGSE